MPELPEVETVRLQLQQKIIGKTILKVHVYHPKTADHNHEIESQLVGKKFKGIQRVGKLLIFSFDNETDLHILCHLKMTGQFFYIDNGGMSGGGHTLGKNDTTIPNSHTRISITFTDNSHLYFNDMRLFGYFKAATKSEVAKARAKFGPEPIRDSFNIKDISDKIRKRNRNIKALMLDQSFVAGLGNIYVDEALWQAKVSPLRQSNTLTARDAEELCAAAGDIMRRAIAVGGTTFQHFADTEGDKGNFTNYLKVFGKQGTPCTRCGHKIIKTRCAGRGTHFCTNCQI